MINLTTTSTLVASLFLGTFFHMDNRNVSPSDRNNSTEITAGTLIDDFSEEIYSWWDSSDQKWKRERQDGVLKVTAKDVGSNYECFGKQFNSIDFSKNQVIKLKMKVDGTVAPNVRIDLKDANGMVANAKPIIKKVVTGDKFVEYYYDYTDKWAQSWPDKQVVDNVEIVELLIFVNPGGPVWNGTLYLDDISTLTVAECPKQ